MKMWSSLLVLSLCLLSSFAFAETYTGRAENITSNARGVVFTVVVEDSKKVEVLRREQWVSTGVMTGEQGRDAIKNVVDRMTQEMYAHLEGIKEVLVDKTVLETYRTTCDSFIETKDRPSPQDIRP